VLFRSLDHSPNKFLGNEMFVTFNKIAAYENFYHQFPETFWGHVWNNIKLFFYSFCSCCTSSEARMNLYKRMKLTVNLAPEPEDVIWENLEFSEWSRVLRKFIVFSISLLIIGLSLGVVVGLNYFQFYAENKGWSSNRCVKYAISILISLFISGINYIMTSVFKELT
jgi:hypothetical protein